MSDETNTPWHKKLLGGFRRTSERLSENLTGLVTKSKLDAESLDDIEDALIMSDLGPATARRIREKLSDSRYERGIDEAGIRQVVADEIQGTLSPVAKPLDIIAFPRPQVILVIGVPNPRSIPGIVTSRGATALASPVATAHASLCTSLCTSQSDASVASEGVLEELESAVELRRRSVIEPERHRPPTRDEERWAIRRDGARRGQGTWRAALITHAASAIEGRAVETRYTLTVAVETRYTLAVAVETRYTLTVETRRPERGEATAAPERRPSRRDL